MKTLSLFLSWFGLHLAYTESDYIEFPRDTKVYIGWRWIGVYYIIYKFKDESYE